jgi:hypothetical protein
MAIPQRCRFCQTPFDEDEDTCPECGEKVDHGHASRAAKKTRKGFYTGSGIDMSDEEHDKVDGKSGCFVATACYGSPMAPEVATFRRWRDRDLKTSSPGRLFVRTYYRFSPGPADLIRGSPAARWLVRAAILEPMRLLVRARLK